VAGISIDEQEEDFNIIDIDGVTFAILNYTYGPNSETLPSSIKGHLNLLCDYNDTTGKIDFTTLNPKVIEDIEKADELADVVIVSPHWGTEYQETPSSYQKKFALEMTEAGADLIIGTHPHVPQPVEWITADNGNQALCYYSLGNYVSTQQNELSMLEEMAWVTFHVTQTTVYESGELTTEKTVEISSDNTGVIPMVCQYTSSPVRLDSVYLLEDYTEELAAKHGIHSYGGVNLKLSNLESYAENIFGDFILKKSDVITTPDNLN
jgi:poly-gamma-glutamate synthesis protein (capsule biosynthesis protein)